MQASATILCRRHADGRVSRFFKIIRILKSNGAGASGSDGVRWALRGKFQVLNSKFQISDFEITKSKFQNFKKLIESLKFWILKFWNQNFASQAGFISRLLLAMRCQDCALNISP
jgi:hypothetical protein